MNESIFIAGESPDEAWTQARLEPKTPPAAPLSLPFNTGRGGHPTPTQLEDYGDLGLIFTDLGLSYI